jgi:hypothetical protein
MHALRSHIALFLLLCLTRTLLPEAWVLALHPHAHTTEEPAQAAVFVEKGKALVSSQHQHCDVEQFYDVAYHAGAPVLVPGPRVAAVYAAQRLALTVSAATGVVTSPTALRGPPARA